jgi:hypothetical protein
LRRAKATAVAEARETAVAANGAARRQTRGARDRRLRCREDHRPEQKGLNLSVRNHSSNAHNHSFGLNLSFSVRSLIRDGRWPEAGSNSVHSRSQR